MKTQRLWPVLCFASEPRCSCPVHRDRPLSVGVYRQNRLTASQATLKLGSATFQVRAAPHPCVLVGREFPQAASISIQVGSSSSWIFGVDGGTQVGGFSGPSPEDKVMRRYGLVRRLVSSI